MNKKFSVILTVIMLCVCFAFAACTKPNGTQQGGSGVNDEQNDDIYFTVTFDSRGGSAVGSQQVLAGNPATAPDSPTQNGFDFVGWFRSDSQDAALWNFQTDRVNQDITLYAHWTEQQRQPTPTDTLTYRLNSAQTGYIVTGDSGQSAVIVIPATHEELPVVAIADSAFAHSKHSDIISVIIPDSVTSIGKNAFYNQDALESVNIGADSALESIDNNAFLGDGALRSVYLPAGLTSLGSDVFKNCSGLDTITVADGNARYSGDGNNLIEIATRTLIRGSNNSVIPQTVREIGEAAFSRAQLTTLTIPSSVVTIEKLAFYDSAITTIIYGGTTEDWNNAVLSDNGKEVHWKSSAQQITVKCSDTAETKRIIVVYFSATGNTEKVAEFISDCVDGTLYEIQPQVPYTAADLDYNNNNSRATTEQRNPDARPVIGGDKVNLENYDVVFIGYPIWWGKAPKIIYTFLESYDFSGKTVIPFCTSASSPLGTSASELHVLASGATWLDGKRFASNATQNDVTSWLNGLTY